MFAELGNNPSLVWRSLLAARYLIREGSWWQVGDGRSIGVFTHPWLSHTPVPLNDAPPDMKVCELIDQDLRQWDRGKIDAMFSPQTWNEILSLPLKNLNSHDSVCWMENRAQKFSVRLAYKVVVRLKNQPMAEHSAARLHAWTWKVIWSLNVPPKIRTFIWWACSNCLPTRDNLHHRRVRVELTCELCKQEPETTTHILWTCPFARNI